MPDHTLTPAEPPPPRGRGRPPKNAAAEANGKPAGNGAPLGFETKLCTINRSCISESEASTLKGSD